MWRLQRHHQHRDAGRVEEFQLGHVDDDPIAAVKGLVQGQLEGVRVGEVELALQDEARAVAVLLLLDDQEPVLDLSIGRHFGIFLSWRLGKSRGTQTAPDSLALNWVCQPATACGTDLAL
jgi:hypothetical protein